MGAARRKRCAEQLIQTAQGRSGIAHPRGVDPVPNDVVYPQRRVITAAGGREFQCEQPLVTQREPTAIARARRQVSEQIGTLPHRCFAHEVKGLLSGRLRSLDLATQSVAEALAGQFTGARRLSGLSRRPQRVPGGSPRAGRGSRRAAHRGRARSRARFASGMAHDRWRGARPLSAPGAGGAADRLPTDGHGATCCGVLLVRSTTDAAALAGPVREALRQLDASVPLPSPRTLAAATRDLTWAKRVSARLATVVCLSTFVLATVGRYAVVAHRAAQRRREFGLRVVLGARTPALVRLVTGHVRTRWSHDLGPCLCAGQSDRAARGQSARSCRCTGGAGARRRAGLRPPDAASRGRVAG